MKKQRTSLALDPEVVEEAQRVADREGVDRADILRRWIRKGKSDKAKLWDEFKAQLRKEAEDRFQAMLGKPNSYQMPEDHANHFADLMDRAESGKNREESK